MTVLFAAGRPAPDRPFPAWFLLTRVFAGPLLAASLLAAPLFAAPLLAELPLRDCPPLRESVG